MRFLLLINIITILFSCTTAEVPSNCEFTGEITETSTLQEDQKTLEDLFTLLETMSKEVTCTNAADWETVAYGKKACGGPLGYIAYNVYIDTECFLQKANLYTKMSGAFNTKHGAVSDCSIAPPPKSISCENGEAVLNF